MAIYKELGMGLVFVCFFCSLLVKYETKYISSNFLLQIS